MYLVVYFDMHFGMYCHMNFMHSVLYVDMHIIMFAAKSKSANKQLNAYKTAIAEAMNYKKRIGKHFLKVFCVMNHIKKSFEDTAINVWIWDPPHDEILDVRRSGEIVIARAYQVSISQGLTHNLFPELVDDITLYIQNCVVNKVNTLCGKFD